MEQFLEYFGFSKNESIVYNTLLKTGGAKVLQIARTTNLKRTSVSEYIRSLENKGFVSATKVGNKYFYRAEDPQKFGQILQERQFILDRVLPQLQQLTIQEKWRANTLTVDEVKRRIKKAKRKGQAIFLFGKKEIGGALINNESLLLFSQNAEMPALQVFAQSIVALHKYILNLPKNMPKVYTKYTSIKLT